MAKLDEKNESSEEEDREERSPWIDAWSNKVAGLHSVSNLMSLYDLKSDGDHKLVICDLLHNFNNRSINWLTSDAKKLKIFSGTS